VDGIAVTGVTVEDILVFVGAPAGSLRAKTLSDSTWKNYRTGLKRWLEYTQIRGISPLTPDTDFLADCIEYYSEKGVSAASVDVMATAVSSVFSWKTNVQLGSQPRITSLIRAAHNLNKTVSKPRRFFDPEVLLSLMEREIATVRTEEQYLEKIAVLLVLCHAMRFSEMASIIRNEIHFIGGGNTVEFRITLKTDQRVRRMITIQALQQRPDVCVVSALRNFVGLCTSELPVLFASKYRGEYRVLSASHISGLVRGMMTRAGIPSEITPYNCKHVGLTKAWLAGATEDELRDVARWSKNSDQFRRNYKVLGSQSKVTRLIAGVNEERNNTEDNYGNSTLDEDGDGDQNAVGDEYNEEGCDSCG
jgi:site-specific recombinase XerD